jgi:hypothetical protein
VKSTVINTFPSRREDMEDQVDVKTGRKHPRLSSICPTSGLSFRVSSRKYHIFGRKARSYHTGGRQLTITHPGCLRYLSSFGGCKHGMDSRLKTSQNHSFYAYLSRQRLDTETFGIALLCNSYRVVFHKVRLHLLSC